MKRPRRRSSEELLNDIKWVSILNVWFQGQILTELKGIKDMASEVVNKVNAKLDAVEQTLRDEADEIKAAIEAAGAGGATPEEVTALETRLDGLNTAIEALTTAPAPPEPPVE